jgi:hypothetical protein
MGHTGGLLRRAVSMVVQMDTYGLEARFWITSELPTIHPECRLTSDRPRNEVRMQTSGKLLVGASAASGYCMQLTATGFRRDHAGSSDFGCAMPRQNLASKFHANEYRSDVYILPSILFAFLAIFVRNLHVR